MSRIRAEHLSVGYHARPVIADLDLVLPDRALSVVVGPNACGKSTLLRALARLLQPESGAVLVGDQAVGDYSAKEFAKVVGLLPQTSIAPDGMVVADLVARGRYPHQGLFRQWSPADESAVRSAMSAADVAGLADRSLDELSGGQRQRVWLAMVLAQETPVVLLDEPTTYLDIAHQLEVLDLARRLVDQGRTVVAVLHDLHLAFRYADHLVVMSRGEVAAAGHPRDVITAELIERVYDLPCRIILDPVSGTPLVIPEERTR